MTTVYQERGMGFKREWAAVPGLRRLMDDIERQTGPDTRVVMAEVTVQMIPYTAVQLDLGHQDIVEDGDVKPRRPQSDEVYTIQVYGFENALNVGKWAVDGERRTLYYFLIFLLLVDVILLLYVFLVV